MFGPNTYFKDEVNINYSHRDRQFFEIYEKVSNLFKEKFNLQNFDILFIPGSATVGIESLMYSLNVPLDIVGPQGTFTNRWTDMVKQYNDRLTEEQKQQKHFELYCLFETSCSTPFYKEGCFIDATSAFPYYDIPQDCLGFVTSLNKQLGSYVGLSVVGIKKDMWSYFKDTTYMSYLNLARYRAYGKSNQTPSTAPTHIFEHFYKVLQEFNVQELRTRVDTICDKVVSVIGENNLIGCLKCPALTIKKGVVPKEICEKYDVYGYWANREHYQLFTYNGSYEDYDKFLEDLKPYIEE